MIYQCRNWVNGTQCEHPEGHPGKHRARFPSGGSVEWCQMCGGKQWLKAADVYTSTSFKEREAFVDWETAAIIPCPACGVVHV